MTGPDSAYERALASAPKPPAAAALITTTSPW